MSFFVQSYKPRPPVAREFTKPSPFLEDGSDAPPKEEVDSGVMNFYNNNSKKNELLGYISSSSSISSRSSINGNFNGGSNGNYNKRVIAIHGEDDSDHSPNNNPNDELMPASSKRDSGNNPDTNRQNQLDLKTREFVTVTAGGEGRAKDSPISNIDTLNDMLLEDDDNISSLLKPLTLENFEDNPSQRNKNKKKSRTTHSLH